MDALIRQMRTRSHTRGPSQTEEGRDGVSRALPRTGEKISKSWFQRQYSKQMNGNNGNHGPGGEDEIAIAIAIAAAAYAVDSLNEPDHGGMVSQGDSAFVRAKSKREMIPQQEPYGNPPLFEIQNQPRAEPSATRFPAAQLEKPQQKRQIGEGSTGGAPEADAWERDEMNRIRVKYEKLTGTIATWEDDKKKSTRRKLDENEREIERRRVKAQKEFRTEMERIGQIAGGARAQADERRKREEAKTREKAERIRRTGKARSNTCSCF
ncbi:hypothetical protein MLD38_005352 [Melastoma candidum]|uniref:Uncharacterized protein n=1 Tax=Melastoma candidum TaxID=119954 RepID=A0ACB9S824_9MYRT|nr:hypothetical protein MLD38_005352 [Melastoma candidum]